MIPKKIHQMWLDKRDDKAPAPDKYINNNDNKGNKFCASFQQLNPTYEYKLWNMADVKELFASEPLLQPWKDFWTQTIRFHIEKCDFARMAVVYIHGGVYADLDFYCHKPLDELIANRSFLWTYDIFNHSGAKQFLKSALLTKKYKNQTSIFNGFFAAAPKHPILAEWMNYMMQNYKYDPDTNEVKVHQTTGPGALGKFAKKMEYTHKKRPELFVDNALILPYNFRQKRRNAKVEPYVSTLWHEGSDWGGEKTLMTQQITTRIIIILLAIVIAIFLLYRFFA